MLAITLAMVLGLGLTGAPPWLWLGLLNNVVQAQGPVLEPDPPTPLASLKTVPVPEPANLGEFVKDRNAAIALGKAFFWDMQVGSGGVQACASCHFAAGADTRSKNQLSPGLLAGDTVFNIGGPNYQLNPHDYPFHKLSDPRDRFSTVLSDTNDVTSSQGVFLTRFVDVVPGSAEDAGELQPDTVFNVNGANVRRVEPRNTPSVINAVFNFHNFWDGRADNAFNGVNPFGERDLNAFVLKVASPTEVEKVQVRLENSSLASQAVGPPLSEFEMSHAGRTFPKLGKKMLALRPLGKQKVHPEDSVLGLNSRWPERGLSAFYRELIQAAFQLQWWDSQVVIKRNPDGSLDFKAPPPSSTDEYTLMEFNFSLFFGLAVQMYESTLIANDTPFDRFMEGNQTALSDAQKTGFGVFAGQGRCSQCHGGAELTNASVANVSKERLERMIMGDGGCAIYDNGFYNIGVRPTNEDLGRGGKDPFGNPLSETRRAILGTFFDPTLNPPLGSVPECDSRANVDGTFKTPSLRNVEFTAPYFHNGGQLTLRQVVEFYNRGGDFREQNIVNVDPDIQALGLTDQEIAALVAFLKALTDDRVRFQQAPFDHPQLFVPDGHPDGSQGGKANDKLLEIPALGRSGSAPLPRFLEEIRPLACSVPADGQEGAVEMSWNAAAEATGYHLWRSRDQGGPYRKSTTAPVGGTSHVDSGLSPGTTFYYVVTDLDQVGSETAYTSEATCTTRPFLDLTAETKSRLASPVREQVPLQARAQSDIGIASVNFLVSGSRGVEAATSAGVLNMTTGLYEATWDTTRVPDGTKTLTATATDSKGQSTLRSFSVLVDNTTPKVTVLKPRDGAVIVGNVEIEVAGDDGPVGSGIAVVEFDVDSAGNWRPLTLDPASGTWKGTWESTPGQHTIHVRATDRARNQSTVTVGITVVTLPDTTIEVHLNGTLLELLTVAISGTVSLDVDITYQGSSVQGIAAVQYQIDGAGWKMLSYDSLTGTRKAVIDTKLLSNGTHTLGISATDGAGNTLQKSYSIQVNNIL